MIATFAATTTASVLADTGNTLPVADTFTATEMASLFELGANPPQLAALSEQEMKSTEGAWGPWGAVAGGISGLAGYTTYAMISGNPWSWSRAAMATGTGAVRGATAGPVGIVWGFNGAVSGGAVRGIITQYAR